MKSNSSVPTLDDVAKLAGVSKSVASRALSGKNRPIAADKKARVVEAAAQLGYVANPFAQSLINQSTGMIAVVVNHISDISDLALFDLLIQSIQSIGKQTLFVRLRSEKDIADIKKSPFVHRVDAALIFSDLIDPEEAPNLFYTDKVIMLNGKKADAGLSVTINESLGIEQAILNAYNRSIKRAVLLCGRKTSITEKQRVLSYQHSMEKYGIDIELLAYCDYSYESALEYLSEHTLDIQNLGIFCTSDAMAMAAVDYCKEQYRDVVERHAIYGFDNTFFSQIRSYQFSTIGYSKQEFINLIIQLLKTEKFEDQQARHLSVDSEFYVR